MPHTEIIEAPDGAPVAALAVHDGAVAVGQAAGRRHPPLSLWRADDPTTFHGLEGPPDTVIQSVRFGFDGTRLYVATDEGGFVVDRRTGTWERLASVAPGVQTVETARHRDRAVFAGAAIEVFDVEDDTTVWRSSDDTETALPPERAAALTPDGATVAAGGMVPGSVLLIEISTGRETGRIHDAPDRCGRLAIAPDGARLAAVGSGGGGVVVANLQTGDRLAPYWARLMQTGYASVAFSPGGDKLALGMSRGYVQVLAIDEDRQLLSEPVHETWVSDVAFLDDRTVLSASDDGRIGVTRLD